MALISCAVTAQLVCVFVFAYAKSRFSYNEAQIVKTPSVALEVSLSIMYVSREATFALEQSLSFSKND